MRSLLLVPVLFALLAPTTSAQRFAAPFVTLKDQAPQVRQIVPTTGRPGSPAGAIVAGILGGTAGLFAGSWLGAGIEGDCHRDDPGLNGAVYGGLIGEGLGLALGAHVGDGLRGNFALDLLASAGGAVLGFGVASATNDPVVLFPAAAAQMMLVVAAELGSARKKSVNQ
jgi:hypothetical protein